MSTTLEIHINEKIEVFDSVGDAIAYITKVIENYVNAGVVDNPLKFYIVKKDAERGPPTLGVHVVEEIKTKDSLA